MRMNMKNCTLVEPEGKHSLPKISQTTDKTPDTMGDQAGQKIYQVSETSEQVKTDGCLQNALIIGGGFTAIVIIVGLAIFLTRRHHKMHYEIKQAWLRRFNTSKITISNEHMSSYGYQDSCLFFITSFRQ